MQQPGKLADVPALALLAIPASFALAMLFLADPAGDWLDAMLYPAEIGLTTRLVLLAGLPALASALATFAICQRRVRRLPAAAAWAVGSGVAAAVLFNLFVLFNLWIECARTGC